MRIGQHFHSAMRERSVGRRRDPRFRRQRAGYHANQPGGLRPDRARPACSHHSTPRYGDMNGKPKSECRNPIWIFLHLLRFSAVCFELRNSDFGF
jgi:hypothetical protein